VRFTVVASLLCCLALGCGKSNKLSDAGGPIDGNTIDGNVMPDAGVPDANQALPAFEVTGGAARLTGTKYKADVQIGHPIDQNRAAGTGHAAEGNAAVKP
jgi:hypothetical protein